MMTSVRYAPGHSPTIVTTQGVVVLGGDIPASLSGRVWAQVAEGRGLAAVLEALTGAFGTSLAALPSFAVALAEPDGVRLAVRGGFSVVVTSPIGVEDVSGAGVTTWSERIVAGASAVSISTETSAVCEYPVRDGVVLTAAVEWTPTDAGSPASAAASPASAAAPAAPAAAPAAPPAPPVPPLPPVTSAADAEPPAARSPWSGSAVPSLPAPPVPPAPVVPAPAEPAAPEAPAPEATVAPGFIDAVPGVGASADTLLPQDSTFRTAPPAAAPVPPAEPEPSDVATTSGYDHLWGATIIRSVEDAAIREEGDDEDAPAAAATPAAPVGGDHDGATISLAQARALRGGASGLEHSVPPLAPPRAPAPGRIRLSTGHVQLLDRTVVIGRRPRSTRVTGTDLPHLISVDSPQQDISRSHLELRVEGDSIVATDLNTTNGSLLLRTGADPVRLHPGEATVVVPGDVLDLGDGITVTIEELA